MFKSKMACGISKEDLIVRVVDLKYKDFLEHPACRRMDFTGRVLSGFIYVDGRAIQTEKQLCFWLQLGIEFVESKIQIEGARKAKKSLVRKHQRTRNTINGT